VFIAAIAVLSMGCIRLWQDLNRCPGNIPPKKPEPAEVYFCFTATADTSIRALLTRAAAWIVAREGFGSGMICL